MALSFEALNSETEGEIEPIGEDRSNLVIPPPQLIQHHPGVDFTLSLLTYDIAPTGLQDLPAALNRSTPISDIIDDHGGYHGFAKWNVSWRYNSEKNGDQCQLEDISVEVEAEIITPKIYDRDEVDTLTQVAFDQFHVALLTHEYGHIDFGILAANEIYDTFNGYTSDIDCSLLEIQANLKAIEILAEYLKLEREYDEDTEHGRTQGAYIWDYL